MPDEPRPKVAFVEIKPWERAFVEEQSIAWGCEPIFLEGTVADLPVADRADLTVLSCFIRSRVDKAMLDDCPNLKLISTRSTGVDHIDVAACNSRGITVCNVPQYGENTVAEHTLGLILALSRNLYPAVDRVKRGDLSIEGLVGFDLHGKTLGVVGAGRIGLHVIRMGRAMNMRVLAFDARPQGLLAEVLGFEYASLEDLLKQSDVVSLHVPLLPATRRMIDAEKFALMKPSAILVNTSRGAVVDSVALLEALNEGRIAGAALDVLEGEEVFNEDHVLLHSDKASVDDLRLAVEGYQLMHHPRCIVTGHIGFYSREALQRILLTTIDNIGAFVQGQPVNLVQA